MNIILLDNFDSFTYNLVDQLRVLGHNVQVYRNDMRSDFIARRLLDDPFNSLLVLSPGPGTPQEAGCMMALINKVAGRVPILGICLGHQAIVTHYGGIVSRAPVAVHGKSSLIMHTCSGVFKDMPEPLAVARYHSLVATSVPSTLDVIATTQDLLVMAVLNRQDNVVGFQFHPESILTTAGLTLLENTIEYQWKACHESRPDRIAV